MFVDFRWFLMLFRWIFLIFKQSIYIFKQSGGKFPPGIFFLIFLVVFECLDCFNDDFQLQVTHDDDSRWCSLIFVDFWCFFDEFFWFSNKVYIFSNKVGGFFLKFFGCFWVFILYNRLYRWFSAASDIRPLTRCQIYMGKLWHFHALIFWAFTRPEIRNF